MFRMLVDGEFSGEAGRVGQYDHEEWVDEGFVCSLEIYTCSYALLLRKPIKGVENSVVVQKCFGTSYHSSSTRTR